MTITLSLYEFEILLKVADELESYAALLDDCAHVDLDGRHEQRINSLHGKADLVRGIARKARGIDQD